MMIFTDKRLMDEKKEADGGGGQENPPAPKAPETPPASADSAQASGPEYDENGYEVDKSASATAEKPAPAEDEAEGVKNPATGYDKEPEVPEEPKEEKPPQEAALDEKDKEINELNVEGLEEDEVKQLKAFIKKHSVSKEVAQALLDERKEENKIIAKSLEQQELQHKREQALRKQKWHNELKNDPDFGGEKFARNIKQVEKALDEFFPGTKKILTERGGMLPPYVMKDLGKLAEKLYAKENLVLGGPGKVEVKQEDEDPIKVMYG